MLKLSNVKLAYGDKAVLDGIDLTAVPGEIIGLVAPNGTGKTTLFNVIANYAKPDAGQILFDGKYAYRNEKEELLIHKKLSTFPEQKDLFEELSGLDHLKLYANMWNGTPKKVPKIIERLDMGHYVRRKVKTYSLGMRQRLCFAMMMAADTPVMLMDEVMNGLDVSNVALISDCLMEMKKEQKLIFVASHLLSNLDLYADRVLYLKGGDFVHEQVLTEKNDVYIKTEFSQEKYAELVKAHTLPAGHVFIADHLLCIPLKDLSEEQQKEWIGRVMDRTEHDVTIGPLGTVEFYEKYYADLY